MAEQRLGRPSSRNRPQRVKDGARTLFERGEITIVFYDKLCHLARTLWIDLCLHSRLNGSTRPIVARDHARDALLDGGRNKDGRVAHLPVLALEEERNDMHGDGTRRSTLIHLSGECPNARMNDRIELLACVCVIENDA